MEKFYFNDIDQKISEIEELINNKDRLPELREDDIQYRRELLSKKAKRMRDMGQVALFDSVVSQEV